MAVVNKVVVKGQSYDIEDAITKKGLSTEVTRATNAETELLARVQGTSESSNPRTDPFKYLGSFSGINGDDLKAALDALHTTKASDNIEGLYRATLTYAVLEIQCIAMHYATDRWMQVLKSPYRWVKSTGKFDILTEPRYRILYRIFENPNGENSTENNVWSDWHDVEQDLEDAIKANSTAIANEITRAKAEETAIRTLVSDLIGESPETLDTIHEIAAWILNDTTGAAAMAKQISDNKAAINSEIERAILKENELGTELQSQTERIDKLEPLVTENGHAIIDLQYTVQDNDAAYKDTFQDLGDDIKTAEAAAIEKGRVLAKRDLFIAAGALYNDTDAAIERTSPWGESVQHLAGHYYLNGIGDITEEQMTKIYNRGYFNDNDKAPLGYGANYPIRTNLCRKGMWNVQEANGTFFAYNTQSETLNLSNSTAITQTGTFNFGIAGSKQFVGNAPNLRIIDPRAIISTTTWSATAFEKCPKLEEVRINLLKSNIVFKDSPVLSKASVLYMIQNAAPTTAITITLHADAYARLAEDSEIIAALEAQPLVTLVSA